MIMEKLNQIETQWKKLKRLLYLKNLSTNLSKKILGFNLNFEDEKPYSGY